MKRNVHAVEDQGVQANIQLNETETVAALLKTEPLLKSQQSKVDADLKKLNEIKARLEDTCKRYQI